MCVCVCDRKRLACAFAFTKVVVVGVGRIGYTKAAKWAMHIVTFTVMHTTL